MMYPKHVVEAQPRVSKPVRPRRPQPRLALRSSRRRPPPTSTRSPRRARASDKRLRAVGLVMTTATVESAGRRVVGTPPSLHVECLEAHRWRHAHGASIMTTKKEVVTTGPLPPPAGPCKVYPQGPRACPGSPASTGGSVSHCSLISGRWNTRQCDEAPAHATSNAPSPQAGHAASHWTPRGRADVLRRG